MADLLETATNGITNLIENPLATGIGGVVVGGVIGGLVGNAIGSSSQNSRRSGRKIKHTRRGWAQDRKRRSKQKWEVAYQRRKRRTGSVRRRKGVHYTKKGQPYIILSSGKARFIKKKRR